MNFFRTLHNYYEAVCDHTSLRAFLYTFAVVSTYQLILFNSGSTDLASKSSFLVFVSVFGTILGFGATINGCPSKCQPNLLTFITIFGTSALVDYFANQYFFLK